jgi:Polysaccharide lyase
MQMKLLSPVVVAVGCLGWASQAQAKVLWVGDFEKGDLSQWDSTNLIKTGDRDNLVLEGDTVAEGKLAAKITLRPDVIFEPYNQSRVEVKHVGLHTMNGEESYYAWSFMVPADAEIRSNIGYWESTPTSMNTMTFFIEPAQGGGTNIKFGTGDLGKTVRWTAKLELNKWHRMAIHNKWSQGTDGSVDVWYDGVQVVTAAMAQKRDVNKLFFQMGLHRSDPAPPIQDIYIDAAMEADSQADILNPLTDPTGMGGSGGGGGMGGASGTAGMTSAGSGGVNGGTGGELSGGSGGTPSPSAGTAAGGAPGSAGTLATLPSGGQAGTASLPLATTNSDTNDSSGCSVRKQDAASARDAWPLLGLLLLGRRRAVSRAAR